MSFREQFWVLMNEPRPEDLQSLAERLGKARWAESTIVTPDPFAIRWSLKGRERMNEIVGVMRQTFPRLLDGNTKQCGNFAYLRFLWHFRKATRELRPPGLSAREQTALVTMAKVIAQSPDALTVFSTFES